jgi:hypothetical protein
MDGRARIERTALDDLYQQAVDQHARKEYETSVNTLEAIYKRDPQYPDVQNIRPDAIARAEQARELRQLYAQGVEQMNREQWDAAVLSFGALRQKDAQYPDVDRQWTTARLWARWSALMREAQDLLAQGRFAASVDKARELQSKGDSYKAE